MVHYFMPRIHLRVRLKEYDPDLTKLAPISSKSLHVVILGTMTKNAFALTLERLCMIINVKTSIDGTKGRPIL